MSDRLREALERALRPDMPGLSPDTRVTLAAAARRLLEAEEVGTRLWCKSHEASTSPAGVCWAKLAHRASSRCVLVPKLLVDPQEGESE